jgi:hypothetical protein
VELFDWQPQVAAFTQRFAARMAATSTSRYVQRVARLVLKSFFLAEES